MGETKYLDNDHIHVTLQDLDNIPAGHFLIQINEFLPGEIKDKRNKTWNTQKIFDLLSDGTKFRKLQEVKKYEII